LKESAQDIKFAPKHKGLMLAVAVSNGIVMVYQWKDPSNLTAFSEFREIKVMEFGECCCLSWNPAFDEPMTLVVGCLITQSLGDQ